MAIRRVRPSKVLVGPQFSRRDFLKLSGTGLAGAALLGTAGCGSVFEGGSSKEGAGSSTLNLNLTGEIPELDSALTSDTISFDVLTNTMEGFYRLNLDNEPIPAAAEGLELTSFAIYFPQQQEFVEKLGDKYGQDEDSLLYNGPYIMTQGSEGGGGTAVFKKNDKYWDKGNVAVNTVNGRIVKEEDTAINLYEGGELDLTSLTGDRVKQYQDSPDFFRFPLPFTVYGRLNQKAPGLDNLNIRKAIMIGFDREGLTEQILQDGSLPAYGYVPPAITPGPGNQTFREANGDLVPKDVDSAKALWEKGVEEVGEEPKLTMLFSDDSLQRDMATYMQDQYKENLGADFDVEVVTFDAALDRVDAEDYQINYSFGWIGDYDDPMTFMDLYLSDSPFNNSFFESKEYDRLIKEAQTTADLKLRMQNMLKAEQILIEQAATVPVYFAVFAGVRKPYFKNFGYHSFGGTDWKYARITGKVA